MPDDPLSIAREAQGVRAQVRRQIRRLVDPHAVVVRLFVGADGKLKDDAVEWLADLGERCFADRSTYDPDPRQHVLNEGARIVFLEIMRGLKLDTRRLASLARELRDADDDA